MLPEMDDELLDLADYHDRDEPGLMARIAPFARHVERLRERGRYLWQHTTRTACARENVVELDGTPRRVIMMSSNNYLGLSTHPRVQRAAMDAIERHGTGAGASPLGAGSFTPHRALERRLADVKETEDACLFTSGYAANLGVLTALARRSDTILLDRLAHASLIDGARATGARLRVFKHNRLDDLEAHLEIATGTRFIVVDAVYSMDGDHAPLPELVELARRHDAWIVLDEAHATGVIGQTGRGLCEHFGLHDERILVVGTLSKALASAGGFFAGPAAIVEYVRHYARSHLFSTALPPVVVAAAAEALEVMLDEPDRLEALRANAALLRRLLRVCGIGIAEGDSPILPIVVGDPHVLSAAARAMLDDGVYVNAVFPPAVPREQSRLRMSVMSTHTHADLAAAASSVAAALGCPGSGRATARAGEGAVGACAIG